MYRPHMNGKYVPIELNAPARTVTADEGERTMPALYGSASVNAKLLTVTLTNPSLDSPIALRLQLEGASAAEARGTVLTHADRQAANSFAKPAEVSPGPLRAMVDGGRVRVTIPAQSVVSLVIRLA